MEKNNALLGWFLILLTLFFGSLFAASYVMVWKQNNFSIWVIPAILSIPYFLFLYTTVVSPLWRGYRKPRTQRQFDSIKPFYQLLLMLGMTHVCLSISLGGIWVYFCRDNALGIQMGAFGLVSLAIPIAYAVVAAIKTIKG